MNPRVRRRQCLLRRPLQQPPDEFARLVQAGDITALTRIPGIGKKTAERLLLELKGKLGADLGALAGAASASDHATDILNALLALGYSEKEGLAAIKNVPAGTGVWVVKMHPARTASMASG